jgi:hypothetical protein
LNGYYSVFNPRGEKIADCGTLRDAVNLVGMRGEGHYYQFKPVYQTIDLEPFPQNQLPTSEIVVNMDGGVGGSWVVEEPPKLNKNEQQPFQVK